MTRLGVYSDDADGITDTTASRGATGNALAMKLPDVSSHHLAGFVFRCRIHIALKSPDGMCERTFAHCRMHATGREAAIDACAPGWHGSR